MYIPRNEKEKMYEDQPQLQLEIYPLEWNYPMTEEDSHQYEIRSYEVDFVVKEVDICQDSEGKRVIIIDM